MKKERKNRIATFVKYSRGKMGLRQEELAEKAGVGLRFIRDLEQGKETIRMDKVNKVLQLLGHIVSPATTKLIDPYAIMLNFLGKNITLELKNKTTLTGVILDAYTRNGEIKSWKIIPEIDKSEYKKTKNERLIKFVNNEEIETLQKNSR